MNKTISILSMLAMCLVTLKGMATPVDDLEATLRDNPQVQEKVYIHTDNSAYFVGDTLWYKAYVVRADNFKPTDMSKLLYVELLTPDGYLVERQHIVVSNKGFTNGQFILQDSLYSGYYEIRAYTRWQLNFNVTERDYTRDDELKFYGKQAAKDFFRDWEGLYSRVVPVYQKPTEAGNYVDRYMAHRPKTRVIKNKDFLTMNFYPEGGQLIEGVPCNIAYELRDNHGELFDLNGTLSDGTALATQHQGRGETIITPTSAKMKAKFTWKGEEYTFTLPDAMQAGATLLYDAGKKQVRYNAKGVTPAAYSVLCRGKLEKFERIDANSLKNEGTYLAGAIDLSASVLPTGVNEIIIYDANAQPLASRLFFINNNDYGKPMDVKLSSAGTEVGKKTTIQPYAPIAVNVQAGEQHPTTVSIAIRDAQTDERGYDNGNIMTDMLLSSELKGFIAYPAYYFESDDAKHKSDLDLLMKVQGWRRYKRAEKLRYQPEKTLTFEGDVYSIPETASILEYENLEGVGQKATNSADKMFADLAAMNGGNGETSDVALANEDTTEEYDAMEDNSMSDEEIEWADNSDTRLGSGRIRKAVLVEAEITKDGEVAGAITHTDKRGHFLINLPPFYDQAFMFVKAYNRNDSVKKCMGAMRGDKDWMNERAFPDYLVRRTMIYPVFSQPYSWYQVNSPELLFVDEDDDANIPETSKLSGTHQLQTVIVKAKRRGRRGINMEKPAIVMDAYRLYNDMTDYGLMLGVCDFNRFPMAASTYLFGNMGRRNQFNIRAMVSKTSFYRNYVPTATEYDKPLSQAEVFKQLRLERMHYVKAYTDYELRTDSGDVVSTNVADVTLDFVPIDNDSKRPTYRDRRYVLDGLTYPEQFYSPDYSNAVPTEPKDYRRTLYWNPNAKLNADGTFSTTIYNNSRETRVSVSAAGIDADGQMYYK